MWETALKRTAFWTTSPANQYEDSLTDCVAKQPMPSDLVFGGLSDWLLPTVQMHAAKHPTLHPYRSDL